MPTKSTSAGRDVGNPHSATAQNSALPPRVEETTSTRICTACGARQPLARFRRRARNSERRHHQCNPCRNRRTRLNREQKRNKGISEWATRVRRQEGIDGVIALIHLMVDRFHGLEAFAETWRSQIAAATPGSKQALDGFRTLVHLWKLVHATAEEAGETPFGQLNDEELQQVIDDLLAAEMRKSEGEQ